MLRDGEMKAKDQTVDLTALRPELSRLSQLISDCYDEFDAPAIVTATTNGTHMAGSLHYRGLAMDLRVKNLGGQDRQVGLHAYLKRAIDIKYPGLYDTLLEDAGGPNAHVHIEASPTLLAQLAATIPTA